jgi:hypothetical protein
MTLGDMDHGRLGGRDRRREYQYSCVLCGQLVAARSPKKICPSCGRDGLHLRSVGGPDPLAERRKAIKAARQIRREGPEGATETEANPTVAPENAGHGAAGVTGLETESTVHEGREENPEENG